jgi:hypothetical protein
MTKKMKYQKLPMMMKVSQPLLIRLKTRMITQKVQSILKTKNLMMLKSKLIAKHLQLKMLMEKTMKSSVMSIMMSTTSLPWEMAKMVSTMIQMMFGYSKLIAETKLRVSENLF